MSQLLEDRIALQDVMLRYAQGVDERDLRLYRSCFTDDVEVVGFAEGTVVGGDAWAEFVKNALIPFGATQHMLGPQLATVDGDTAHCRTDVQAVHCMKEPEGEVFTLLATYVTDMVRINGQWKIKRHELVTRTTRREKVS